MTVLLTDILIYIPNLTKDWGHAFKNDASKKIFDSILRQKVIRLQTATIEVKEFAVIADEAKNENKLLFKKELCEFVNFGRIILRKFLSTEELRVFYNKI